MADGSSQDSGSTSDGATHKTEEQTKNIESFVFVDIETSGLSNDARVMEVSLIAVSRKDLLAMKDAAECIKEKDTSCSGTKASKVLPLPRIMHKYTRLYYPFKIIYPEVEKITGLSNDALCTLQKFTEDSAQGLKLFLNLNKPVCLVAHNGSRYDFPILKSEILNVGSSLEPDILCIDTLPAFKELDMRIQEKQDLERKGIEEIMEFAQSLEDLPSIDEVNKLEPELKRVHLDVVGEAEDSEQVARSILINGKLTELSSTPAKSYNKSNYEPSTPRKNIHPPVLVVTPVQTSSLAGAKEFKTPSGKSSVRRALDYSSPNFKSYRQPILYKRIFGVDYDAHRAESDALALLQICGYYGKDFVNWADENAQAFAEVRPRWFKRKSFSI